MTPPSQKRSLIPLSNPESQTKDSLALRDSPRRHWAPWSLWDSQGLGDSSTGAHIDRSHVRGHARTLSSEPAYGFQLPSYRVTLLHSRRELYILRMHRLNPCCCCCSVASVVSDSVRPHRRQPTRLPNPWDSPGKNTEVGCHFLLQCMKVKSQSEVAQLCPTPSDPMDCSPPGSSVHGIFQARVLEWGAIAFSASIPT